MSTTLIEVRPAKAADATAVASTHDEAWRSAYQGIIPGAELEMFGGCGHVHHWEELERFNELTTGWLA